MLDFALSEFLSGDSGGGSADKYVINQQVYSQGDQAEAIFYVQSGRIKVSVLSAQGKAAVVAILGEGDFLGEACLGAQLTRTATVIAITECCITRVEKSIFARALHDEPVFSDRFVAHLLGRSIRIEEDLVDQLFNSSERRLARALLLLANYGRDTPPEPVLARISQETLAEMIGTTRSRVSFFMNKFRRLGFISYDGTVEVHPSLLTAVLCNQSRVDDIPN
ncbi:Crp/Fnr family transcriptional regulator [Kaistia dalseonensis]|uniref:Crp/Fnr family transcriptional regulator n=1 Tax=Kaistia dalseonensis TaxID=410840 RepID=UPI0022531185|nr:Crp/Fnr family transcriptional regulator [Kaistia dalseonensis]MCX5496174.1 Crp/Fnr family transcriptional regulator [Kaistia dalseonensis]